MLKSLHDNCENRGGIQSVRACTINNMYACEAALVVTRKSARKKVWHTKRSIMWRLVNPDSSWNEAYYNVGILRHRMKATPVCFRYQRNISGIPAALRKWWRWRGSFSSLRNYLRCFVLALSRRRRKPICVVNNNLQKLSRIIISSILMSR